MRKTLWLVTSALMMLSLVMAACGPAAVEEKKPAPLAEEKKPAPPAGEEKKQEAPVVKEAVKPGPEVPKYGGVFTTHITSDPLGFDEGFTPVPNVTTVYLTNSRLLTGDWAKGRAGSGETDWQFGIAGDTSLFTGDLATGWELVLPDTLIFRIRQGVKFAVNPDSAGSRLVGGREFTADDAAYSLNRNFLEAKGSTMYGRFAGIGTPPKSIKARDKYTVEVKVPPDLLGNMVVMMGNFTHMVAREVIDRYGDMKDWKNSVGTGPWILKDYVAASAITFVRNPNYFMRDPIHPENQLPYLDRVVWLNLPDASTQQAAFRTGKLDRLTGLQTEEKNLLMKQRPELLFTEQISQALQPVGRQDKKELPFKDIRVRQAMNLAVNKQRILDQYYGGYGVLFAQPVTPTPSHRKLFTPLEDQPKEPTIPGSRASVQELFTYNPEKAKQLLKEAGYPNGFKTEIIATSAQVDYLAIIREDFLKVGIDMAIKPLETAVYTSQYRARTFAEMKGAGALDWNFPQTMITVTETYDNPGFLNYDRKDERINEAYKVVAANIGINNELWQKTLKELYPYLLELASFVWMPAYYTYTLWWPWLKNYHAEGSVGYFDPNRFSQYIWVDPELKKKMGY